MASETGLLTKPERKILDVIKAHPGELLWHEAGEKAYPNSLVRRTNLFGEPFHELNGRASHLTYTAIGSLTDAGLIRKDERHRYYATGADDE